MVDQQLQIKHWFDETYRKRGFQYLRPVQAYEIFKSVLLPGKGKVHLDVGCGPGLLLEVFLKNGAICHGLDISQEAIELCKRNCPEAVAIEGNAENLPYKDQTFDSISCIGSLERMIDRNRVLMEKRRVLKDSGEVCIMVRNSENITWKYFWKPLGLYNRKGHQDANNLQQWKSLFEQSGFEILRVYPDHWPYYRLIQWFKPDYSRIRRFPFSIELAYEFIFHLRKK